MAMSDTEQQTVFGDPVAEQVRIETSGRTLRPFKRAVEQVAGEFRLQVREDGLFVSTTDTANVILIEVALPADEFDVYEVTETELGVPTNHLGSALQHARYGKSTDDEVTITADTDHLETVTQREYGETNATVTERVDLIDPAGIRQTDGLEDLDLAVEVDLSPDAFREVVTTLDDDASAVMMLSAGDDSIQFQQDADTVRRNIELDASPSTACEETYFSTSYLSDIATVLSVSYADELTLRWDDTMPLIAEFNSPCGFAGEVVLAPRVGSGDDDE